MVPATSSTSVRTFPFNPSALRATRSRLRGLREKAIHPDTPKTGSFHPAQGQTRPVLCRGVRQTVD